MCVSVKFLETPGSGGNLLCEVEEWVPVPLPDEGGELFSASRRSLGSPVHNLLHSVLTSVRDRVCPSSHLTFLPGSCSRDHS